MSGDALKWCEDNKVLVKAIIKSHSTYKVVLWESSLHHYYIWIIDHQTLICFKFWLGTVA